VEDVIDTDHPVAVSSIADLAWEAVPNGLAGAYRKVLALDEYGDPRVMLIALPAGAMFDHPHRHYHQSLHDFNYILWGTHPLFEYAGATAERGVLTMWRPGYYMHRSPGSIHGIEVGTEAPTTCVTLHWRTKSGNWVGDPTYETETVQVEYPSEWTPEVPPREARPQADGVVLDWPKLRELDTREMPWGTAQPSEIGIRRKVLERDTAGAALVEMLFIPPGTDGGVSQATFLYVLGGSLGTNGKSTIGPGHLVEGQAAVSACRASPPGALALAWRIRTTDQDLAPEPFSQRSEGRSP
jgi:hypothetical protein